MKNTPPHDAFHPVEHGGVPDGWRARLHVIIFGIDTPAGRIFDIILVGAILLSILVVVLNSVPEVGERYSKPMYVLEWFFTLLFTVELVARLITARHPLRYLLSFYGMIDLLSVMPTYSRSKRRL